MSENVSSVKTNASINFTWWDETGSLPDERIIDTLHESALLQVASGILKGERKGKLVELLSVDGESVSYQGEWDLEPNWRLKSRNS